MKSTDEHKETLKPTPLQVFLPLATYTPRHAVRLKCAQIQLQQYGLPLSFWTRYVHENQKPCCSELRNEINQSRGLSSLLIRFLTYSKPEKNTMFMMQERAMETPRPGRLVLASTQETSRIGRYSYLDIALC